MTQANPPSMLISRSKTAALSRITDAIPKGYCYWISGCVAADKAIQLAEKFHRLYGIACSPGQRITRKQKKLANTLLVLYWPENAEVVEWLLLATEGSGLEAEILTHVKDKPRLYWQGYELVQYYHGKKLPWTWRRPKEAMTEWFNLLSCHLNQHRMDKVAEVLETIAKQPGFHGVRNQSKNLLQFAKLHGYKGELPFLFHVEKMKQGERVVLRG